MKPIEPFGYFRAEPFGWTNCAELDILKHHHAYAIAKGAIEEIEALK